MTKQADMSEAEKIHIIEISKRIIERLEFVKNKPNSILDYSTNTDLSTPLLQKIYPDAKIIANGKADFIFAALSYPIEDISSLFSEWKKNLNPSGFLLFGLINANFDMCEIGDFLMYLGFVDVVMDLEGEVIYGYCKAPACVEISITEIHRGH
jgi:hypothetical protein